MRGGGVTRQSVHSVKNLKRIRKIRHLLSAWDEPQKGEVAYRQMDRALACLQKIHTATIGTSADWGLRTNGNCKKICDSARPAPTGSNTAPCPHLCSKSEGPGSYRSGNRALILSHLRLFPDFSQPRIKVPKERQYP